LEEERRLAYVGLTRARKRAFISYAANRRLHGQWQSAMPSRFIDELPADHVELKAEPGLPHGGRGGGGGEFYQDNSSWPRTRVMAPRSFKAPLIEGRATRVEMPRVDGQYRSGDRVFHQKFGYGSVRAVSDDKLTIDFDKAGSKMVIANFITKADDAGKV
jgi:DNA helicase-2/ATP-dependent DNA helicase PcrA